MSLFVDWMRRGKEWMESFAEKPYAMTILFFLAFAESSFFPIPPDVLLIAIAVSAPIKSLKAAFWCSIGSVFGGILGYYIGWGLMESVGNTIVEFYNAQEYWQIFLAKYELYGVWFLAAASFSPIPYKISTIASGAANMDLITFIRTDIQTGWTYQRKGTLFSPISAKQSKGSVFQVKANALTSRPEGTAMKQARSGLRKTAVRIFYA